jgi:uncharacterized SAM-binding protein YcdF (DUF218 family)
MEKAQPRYDAVIGLGKNWGNKKESKKTGIFYPSIDTAMTAIACAEEYLAGNANKIMYSTGDTFKGPSEAEAMRLQLRSMFSEEEIPDEDIILEERSIDTPGNAEEVAKIISERGMQHIKLVTVSRHLKRSETLFRIHGITSFDSAASEDILEARGFAVKREEKERWLEAGLTKLLTIDPKGNIPRLITQIIRK